MPNSNTQETTSLTTQVIESSLEWNIENFQEYAKCDIGSIASRKIAFEGTEAFWILHIHPNGYHPSTYSHDEKYVSVSIQIIDQNPSESHCFKIEVKTNFFNLASASNSHRNTEESDGFMEALNNVKPIAWNVEYKNIGRRTHLELFEEKFIKVRDLHSFLVGGALRIGAMVSMKCMRIVDTARTNHDFH